MRCRSELRALKSCQQSGGKGIDHRPGVYLEARSPITGGESELIPIGPFRPLQGALLEKPEQSPGTGGLKDPGAARRAWIEHQPGAACRGLPGPGDLRRACRTMRVGHRRAADIERDLRRCVIEVDRCDVKAHARSVAA